MANPDDAPVINAQLRAIVREELDKGTAQGFGRGYLYTHFRNQGYIASRWVLLRTKGLVRQEVANNRIRDRLFAIVKELDPEGVAARAKDMQRHRGDYIVPGPNYVWSLDGYCKFDQFGFEIYAAIDAYSRYVIWIYVDISARTSVIVLRQYLDTISDLQVLPKILRTDRGSETPLCANAHYNLRKVSEFASSEEVTFQRCYFYGTSTANQRIEAWWGQLSKGSIFHWRVSTCCSYEAFTNC